MKTWQRLANFTGSWYSLIVILITNVFSVLCGISLGWPSPILAKLGELTDENPLGRITTDQELSLIGSLSSVGGILGPLLFTYIIDKYSRKMAIITTAVPLVAAYIIAAFAQNVEMFYVCRILIGIVIGGSFTIVPIYIAEISDARKRGTYASLSTSFIMCGVLLSYSVGPYMPMFWFNILIAIFALVFIPMFFFSCPESPYYSVQQGHEHTAVETLKRLRAVDSVWDELSDIKETIQKEVKGTILDIFKTKVTVKILLFVTTLLIIQQLSGITVLLTYSQDIFKTAGGSLRDDISTIIVGVVQVGTCFITPIASRKFGRKPMLIFSCIAACLTEVILGLYYYLDAHDSDTSNVKWLPVVSLVLYIFFYNCGLGALPWVIMSEMYPLNVKSVGASLSTSIYWIVGFLLTYFYGDMKEIGLAAMYWMFGGCCALGAAIVYFYAIETKNKSLQEIQNMLI